MLGLCSQWSRSLCWASRKFVMLPRVLLLPSNAWIVSATNKIKKDFPLYKSIQTCIGGVGHLTAAVVAGSCCTSAKKSSGGVSQRNIYMHLKGYRVSLNESDRPSRYKKIRVKVPPTFFCCCCYCCWHNGSLMHVNAKEWWIKRLQKRKWVFGIWHARHCWDVIRVAFPLLKCWRAGAHAPILH